MDFNLKCHQKCHHYFDDTYHADFNIKKCNVITFIG